MAFGDIIIAATRQYRKDGTVTVEDKSGVRVVELYDMPHLQAARSDEKLVDMHFITIGVDEKLAKEAIPDILAYCDEHPRMEEGPSYIEIGADIGDQGLALCLMALGEVAGIWTVITPEMFGFEGAQAHEMAGHGYIMTSGVKRPEGVTS